MGAGSPSSNDVSLTQVAAAKAAAPVGSPPQPQGNGAHSTNGKNGHNGNGHHPVKKPHGNALLFKTARKNWQRRFLAYLLKTGNIQFSARKAGVSKSWIHELRERDPEFAAAVTEAVEIATANLEEEIRRRAQSGTRKPVFYQGSECGTVREFSDTLAMFILKARKPEIYRDNPPAVTVHTNVSQHTDVTKAFEQIAADNSRVADAFETRLSGRN